MKIFYFSIFDYKSKLIKEWRNNIVTTIKKELVFSKDFSYNIKSLLFTKEINKIGIFRFFLIFQKYEKWVINKEPIR